MVMSFFQAYFMALPVALIIGFLLDQVLGDPDPKWFPHPVRWIGALVRFLEKRLYPQAKGDLSACKRRRGTILVMIVITLTPLTVLALLFLAYSISVYLMVVLMCIMNGYAIAVRSMKTESDRVYQALQDAESIDADTRLVNARAAVGRIVGRNTDVLDEAGVIKACVETIAEGTCDGIIAPIFYLAVGGPILGFLYKAINTMDSMIGYKSVRYLDFGRAAARLDDVASFLPARLAAGLFLITAPGNRGDAWRIFCRDRNKTSSPNAGQTESVIAGMLGVELGGNAIYHGELHEKPTLGDPRRQVTVHDIRLTQQAMYRAAWLGTLLFTITQGTVPCVILN